MVRQRSLDDGKGSNLPVIEDRDRDRAAEEHGLRNPLELIRATSPGVPRTRRPATERDASID
jgi:hypothetical protein